MITSKPWHYGLKTYKRDVAALAQQQDRYVKKCIIGSPKWKPKLIQFSYGNRKRRLTTNNNKKREEEEQQVVGLGERKVKCEVEVISWRERRIKAEISVNADVDSVWTALTDYERLADFIPNLVSRIWLEQRGLQRALYWHIEARVETHRELHFSMVDGDFKKFEGKWSVKSRKGSSSTTLGYEVNVIPTFNFPAIFLERIISSDLPVNLQALAFRSETDFKGNLNTVSQGSLNQHSLYCGSTKIEGSTSQGIKDKFVKAALPSSTGELNSHWGIFGKSCPLDRPCMVDEVHLRRFDGLLVSRLNISLQLCFWVTNIDQHVSGMKENGGVHRCVVACITVKAPVREVWSILTAYESLPEIVPNLAISKVLSRENNKVRILQEGCKGLLYMVLHARVVLDLCELLAREISFEQVEGDFDSFRGKWILEKLGTHHTLLKYSVESKMHKNSFLSEAIMEEVIYEDLPSNLCAIRDYIEKREMENHQDTASNNSYAERMMALPNNRSSCNYSMEAENSNCKSSLSRQKPKVPGLQRDVEVLKSELLNFISEHGQEGFMPMRKQLRKHGRVDIEKAITRMGGFRKIASLMNLSLAYKCRKPKGYWDNLENLQEEINRFQRNWGMDPSFMPSRKSFERAGRYDIARALEKWGGLHEVSRLLSLKVRHPNRQAALSKENNKPEYLISNNLNFKDKISPQPHTSQDTHTWLMKLKDFDINWVE
ncbi:cyclase/dehydrase family protein [Striga asiatica]|uniref:Cyclase/dehydrase family protein n=1 Tax=Striga asiatica TaxID=4170 RepID=A0A5A7PZV6_STRAF|nr:cyclase/dehydrase family protein [Striga asiatica]